MTQHTDEATPGTVREERSTKRRTKLRGPLAPIGRYLAERRSADRSADQADQGSRTVRGRSADQADGGPRTALADHEARSADQDAADRSADQEAVDQDPRTEAARTALAVRRLPVGFRAVLVTVILITTATAALAFLFSYGNGRQTALDLGTEPWLAPLITPAVDLSVIGLLLGIQWAVLGGARTRELLVPHAFLVFCGLATWGINAGPAAFDGRWGKAALDSVAPILLLAWTVVAPILIRVFVNILVRVSEAREALATAITHATAEDKRRAAEALAAAELVAADAERTAAELAERTAREAAAIVAEARRTAAEITDQAGAVHGETDQALRQRSAELDRRERRINEEATRVSADRTEARELADQAAADRKLAAADRSAAEELVAGGAVRQPRAPRTERPAEERSADRTPRTLRAVSPAPADGSGRKSADQLLEERTELAKRIFDGSEGRKDWRTEVVTKSDVMEALSLGGGQANPIRAALAEAREALEEAS